MLALCGRKSYILIEILAGHGTSSTFFRVDCYFDFITINAETITSYKSLQNDRRVKRSIVRITSEIAGNSVLIPSQNLFNIFKKLN